LSPPEKKWWELELQAPNRGADDPAGTRSIGEDVPVATQRHAVWWSAFDSNNVVDVDAPAPTPSTVKTEDADESNDDDFGSSSEGDDSDDADNLDFSALGRRH
jgi:hypothetical protein